MNNAEESGNPANSTPDTDRPNAKYVVPASSLGLREEFAHLSYSELLYELEVEEETTDTSPPVTDPV